MDHGKQSWGYFRSLIYAYFKTLNLLPTLLLSLTTLLLNSYIAMVNPVTHSFTFSFLIAHITIPLGTLFSAITKFTKAKWIYFFLGVSPVTNMQ